MLGYAANQKAYKLWDIGKGEIAVSRDVVFDEHAQSPQEGHEDNDINVGNYNDDNGDVYKPPNRQHRFFK